MIKLQRERRDQKNNHIVGYDKIITQTDHPVGVIVCLIVIAGADTNTDHCHDGQFHRTFTRVIQCAQTVHNTVGSNLRSAVRCDNYGHQNFSQLEKSVLCSVGNGNCQNFPQNWAAPAENLTPFDVDGIPAVEGQADNDKRSRDAADQGRPGYAGDALIQNIHTEVVAGNINCIHQKGYAHRHISFIHGSEQGSTAVVDSEKWKR